MRQSHSLSAAPPGAAFPVPALSISPAGHRIWRLTDSCRHPRGLIALTALELEDGAAALLYRCLDLQPSRIGDRRVAAYARPFRTALGPGIGVHFEDDAGTIYLDLPPAGSADGLMWRGRAALPAGIAPAAGRLLVRFSDAATRHDAEPWSHTFTLDLVCARASTRWDASGLGR